MKLNEEVCKLHFVGAFVQSPHCPDLWMLPWKACVWLKVDRSCHYEGYVLI